MSTEIAEQHSDSAAAVLEAAAELLADSTVTDLTARTSPAPAPASPFSLRDDNEFAGPPTTSIPPPAVPPERQQSVTPNQPAPAQSAPFLADPASAQASTDHAALASHSVQAGAIPIQYFPLKDASPVPLTPTQRHPFPGVPPSPYRRCSCLGVMPGRACLRCNATKWMKVCQLCEGQGRLDRSRRDGAERSETCSGCRGVGQVPATLGEIRDATTAAEVAQEREEEMRRAALATSDPASAPADPLFSTPMPLPAVQRRAARLPSIGATEKKRNRKKRPASKSSAKSATK